jgi:hypothetical protein
MLSFPGLDQACAEADSCRSANPFQGDCHHRRLGGTCWLGHQDLEGSRDCYPCGYHHCEAECGSHPKRLLGCQLGGAALAAHQGERQVWLSHRSRKLGPLLVRELGRSSIDTVALAYSCTSRYGPRRLASRQASSTAGWHPGCVHFFSRLDQDPREHAESDLCCSLEHIWLPDTEPVEGDEA